MKRIVWTSIIVILILLFLLPGTLWFLDRPTGKKGDIAYFEIEKGDTAKGIAKKLMRESIIRSPEFFIFAARITKRADKLQAGYYALDRGSDTFAIIKTIADGKVKLIRFSVPEGKNIYEIARIVADAGVTSEDAFIQAAYNSALLANYAITAPSFEGYLFPSTYYIAAGRSAADVIQAMANEFFKVYDVQAITKRAKELNRSFAQIVTLASIIEKETGAEDERTLISAVFHNRLKVGERLRTDPTVIYAMTLTKGRAIEKPNIKRDDLTMRHSYNTYMNKGLPPGPIANPSERSMIAALYPADVDYLFFVADGKGGSVFTKDYETHQKNIKKYILK